MTALPSAGSAMRDKPINTTHKRKGAGNASAANTSGSASHQNDLNGKERARDEARAVEKRKVAARREVLLAGLSVEDQRVMTSFMGAVTAKARSTLQTVVGLIASSGEDPRLLFKKVLVHSLGHLDIDRCVSFLNTAARVGEGATLQLLWLYERYNIPNAGGRMTKCTADHFGRDLGVGRFDRISGMQEEAREIFVRQLADWSLAKKVKVLKAWEASDPRMTVDELLGLILEEQERGEGPGNLWLCSVCPLKREIEIEAKMSRGEHRRKDRTVDAGALYGYRSYGKGGTDVYRSQYESAFHFTHPGQIRRGGEADSGKSGPSGKREAEDRGQVLIHGGGDNTRVDLSRMKGKNGAGVLGAECGHGCAAESALPANLPSYSRKEPAGALHPASNLDGRVYEEPHQQQQVHNTLELTYARRRFDRRRMCGACTEELRGWIVSYNHDLELWHTVDHERRALLTEQRQQDKLKAQWVERERNDRQLSEVLRFICEANLDAFSRHSLQDRAEAGRNSQAEEVRRLLDLKMADLSAVKQGASKDDALKRLNEREATAWAATLRLKACLNLDRRYASLDLGGIPASLRRRHGTSTKPADFLEDGTPATPQGASMTFGRNGPPDVNESGDLRHWKQAAESTEELFDRRRELREWQLNYGRRARFSYLCGRWVGAASDIEEKTRQKRMLEEAERERRKMELEAAKLRRKLQLAELRVRAGSRANGDARRRVQRDRESDNRRKRERQELDKMRREEAAQLAGGDRYWGLMREMHRLRAIEEARLMAWEVRIRATREKMVAVRCISERSDFTHAVLPPDPELTQKIERLAAM